MTTFPGRAATALVRTIKDHGKRLKVAEQRVNVLASQNASLQAQISNILNGTTIHGNLVITGTLTVDQSVSVTESIGASGEIYANGGIDTQAGLPVILGGNSFSNLNFLNGISELSHVGTLGGSPTAADCGTAINAILNQLTGNGFMF